MSQQYKYPQTPHLPESDPASSDNRLTEADVLKMFAGKEVWISEKLDGENTSMYPDRIHARSCDSRSHASRDWVKALWSCLRYNLPEGYRICGENMYAKHAIYYPELASYFYAFSVWNGGTCLSVADTMAFLRERDIYAAPSLYRGKFDISQLEFLKEFVNNSREEVEGFVIRNCEAFNYIDFKQSVAKFVRADHVQRDEVHWFNSQIICNGLVRATIKENT